jgi:hypothetical protein
VTRSNPDSIEGGTCTFELPIIESGSRHHRSNYPRRLETRGLILEISTRRRGEATRRDISTCVLARRYEGTEVLGQDRSKNDLNYFVFHDVSFARRNRNWDQGLSNTKNELLYAAPLLPRCPHVEYLCFYLWSIALKVCGVGRI